MARQKGTHTTQCDKSSVAVGQHPQTQGAVPDWPAGLLSRYVCVVLVCPRCQAPVVEREASKREGKALGSVVGSRRQRDPSRLMSHFVGGAVCLTNSCSRDRHVAWTSAVWTQHSARSLPKAATKLSRRRWGPMGAAKLQRPQRAFVPIRTNGLFVPKRPFAARTLTSIVAT